MTLTRRSFIQGVTASLATFIVPGQRRHIDLMEFCGENHHLDCSLPHRINDWTFATDARLAVRVRPILSDAFHHKSDRVPPFHSLPWDRNGLVWKPMLNVEPIVASETPCPQCDGEGYWPKPPDSAIVTCANCFGEGCRDCKDRGTYAEGYSVNSSGSAGNMWLILRHSRRTAITDQKMLSGGFASRTAAEC